MSEYKWYTVVDGDESLQQGDFIFSCPYVIPEFGTEPESESDPKKEVPAEIDEFNVIVMSQSCDLEHGKLQIVLVCPFLTWDEVKDPRFKSRKGREKLKEGTVIGYHLLNKCDVEGFEMDYVVVDLRNMYGVPFGYLKQRKDKRLRLMPPYREHLAQSFARLFMRVGLPEDIPDSFLDPSHE